MFVLSVLGWVQHLNAVKALKLYTNEHPSQTSARQEISSRWHDTRNNSVWILKLKIERRPQTGKAIAFISWMPGYLCVACLDIGITDPILKHLAKVFSDLNILHDLSCSRTGQITVNGVLIYKLVLSTAMTICAVIYFGSHNFERRKGLDGGYAILSAMWVSLYNCCFEPFLGPTIMHIENIARNMKMAVLYSIAHDNGDVLFADQNCSWAIKVMRGSHPPPEASLAELFLATHTVIMDNAAVYQVAMTDGLVSKGTVVRHENFLKVGGWKRIFRTGERQGAASE